MVDFALAGTALVALSPILLFTAAAIVVTMGRPVLFRQLRAGRHGHLFEILKFRTMTHDPDAEVAPAADAARLTGLGRWLRMRSLDELPQLWNVVRGDMSLVGPRPLLPEYLPRYSREQARRHEVRPGLTGWAQVNGRNAITWEEKFALDVWYVDHRSLWLDLRILARTIEAVVAGRGVTEAGQATARPFEGDQR